MENAARFFLTFLCYSFLGWACECIYCFALDRKWTNRGFLAGPLCPVYGFGALLIYYALRPLHGRVIALFLCGMLLTSVLEYLTSLLLEKLFHMSWWDYSNNKFNLNGRVCLRNSTLFGLLAVALLEWIAPAVNALVALPGPVAVQWTAFALWSVLEADLILTVHAILVLNGKLAQLAQMKKELQIKTAEMRELFKEKIGTPAEVRIRTELDAMSARVHAMESAFRFPTRRLIAAFPNMRSLRDSEAMRRIRAALRERTAQRQERRRSDNKK